MQYYSGQTVNICKLKKKDVIISIYSVLLIYNQKIKSVCHLWWTLYLNKKDPQSRCWKLLTSATLIAALQVSVVHIQLSCYITCKDKKKKRKNRKPLLPFDQEETTLQSKLCSSVVVGSECVVSPGPNDSSGDWRVCLLAQNYLTTKQSSY